VDRDLVMQAGDSPRGNRQTGRKRLWLCGGWTCIAGGQSAYACGKPIRVRLLEQLLRQGVQIAAQMAHAEPADLMKNVAALELARGRR
jgi:hypothetical protein